MAIKLNEHEQAVPKADREWERIHIDEKRSDSRSSCDCLPFSYDPASEKASNLFRLRSTVQWPDLIIHENETRGRGPCMRDAVAIPMRMLRVPGDPTTARRKWERLGRMAPPVVVCGRTWGGGA